MADIVNVSDSLLRFANKTRLFSDSSTLSDAVVRLIAKTVTKSLTENITSAGDVIEERRKQRLSTDTVTIAETIQLYKNGMMVEPVAEIPTPQNIIGTRERRVRAVKRAPRAIVIDEIKNVAITALKVLAFAHEQNRIQTPLLLLTKPQRAISPIRVGLQEPKARIRSRLKTNLNLETILLPLKLSSTDLIALGKQTARASIRLSDFHLEPNPIESLKPINPERIDKLYKLVTIAMMMR